jgi:TRAP-type C4-dicarboxylate transport system substrate-binding protein
MYTTAGDDQMVRVYQRRSFHPIALAANAVPTGLTSGMIEAMPTTPSIILFLQLYGRAKFMLDVPLAPLIGATVVTTRAWRGIGEADRAAMLAAAAAAEARAAKAIPKQDEESIAVMKAKGLTVTPARGEDWNAEAQGFAEDLKAMVPDDVYAAALRERDAYRHQAAGR